jgi:hypothetical protein
MQMTAGFSETLETTYQITGCHNGEDNSLKRIQNTNRKI